MSARPFLRDWLPETIAIAVLTIGGWELLKAGVRLALGAAGCG